jgi:hypothetical protein
LNTNRQISSIQFQYVADNSERCLTFMLSYLVYSQIFLWMITASATTQKCRITHCKKTLQFVLFHMCCKSTWTLKKVSFYAGRSHNLQGFLMHKTFQTLIEQVFISINQSED